MDRERLESVISQWLSALGLDPKSPELRRTPQLAAAGWERLLAGQGQDPLRSLPHPMHIKQISSRLSTGPLGLGPVEFSSICEHHLTPFSGQAWLVYSPDEWIGGLGDIVMVLEVVSSRLQLQERLGEDLVEVLERWLKPRGVLVRLRARHGCIMHRGPKTQASFTTVAARGSMADGPGFLAALGFLDKA